MTIKIQGTTVIDDSKNVVNATSVQYADSTIQTTATPGASYGTKVISKGSLLYTLNNPNAYSTSANDNFAISVAISGDYAIVGAYQEDDVGGTSSGKAYIYNVTTGQLIHTLNNPNAYGTSAGDAFGNSVAISGDYAIVGAYQEDDVGGTSSGKAYIYNVTTGQLIHTLNNPNAYGTSAGDAFGNSVAISGDYAIVGAQTETDAGGNNSGKAYIFNVTTGKLIHTLNNPNAYGTSAGDAFGSTVAISGNYAIVGAPTEDDATYGGSGKAYMFNVTTGQLIYTFNNPSPSNLDYFGEGVAINDKYIAIGEYYDNVDGSGFGGGRVHVFDIVTKALVQTLNNPNAYSTTAGDYFGQSISISGNYVIVGALYEDDVDGTSSGKAYIFNVTTGQLAWTLNNPNAYGTIVGDWFGYSVALSGNYAIVSALGEDDAAGTNSGKAYIIAIDDVYSDTNIKKIKFDTGIELDMSHAVFSIAHTQGQLLKTLDNPNAYSTSSFDLFGASVAISGNYAIVGTPYEDDAAGLDSGKTYIYNVTTGQLVHTLNNPNAYSTSTSDQFGYSVAISGNYAIVGTPTEDDASGVNSGKAYIYNVITGTLLYVLNNPNAYSTLQDDNFGRSVAISGDYAIVSAFLEDDANGTDSGKAYIFNVITGALVSTLNNPNPYDTSTNDQFGNSVAISGNYAIVGTRYEKDAGGTFSGKAYIYNVTTGALLYTLNNPNAYSTSAGDQFGNSVAISGNYAIVSAPYEDDAGGSDSGKAYIFNVTTGQLVHTLNNPNAYSTSAGDQFGNSVAISGNYAIVGAYTEYDANGSGSGKAYIYNVTTGQLVHTLNNPNAYSTSANDNFGFSVSISGNYAIVGAYSEGDAAGGLSGKAYIFATRDLTYLDKLTTLAESL